MKPSWLKKTNRLGVVKSLLLKHKSFPKYEVVASERKKNMET